MDDSLERCVWNTHSTPADTTQLSYLCMSLCVTVHVRAHVCVYELNACMLMAMLFFKCVTVNVNKRLVVVKCVFVKNANCIGVCVCVCVYTNTYCSYIFFSAGYFNLSI